MNIRKYEFVTDDTISAFGVTLTRIRSLIDIPGVCKAGDLGGYLESENNLGHEGKCWVSRNALVYENAQVFGDAQISGNSRIYGNAMIYGNARVYGNAQISGNSRIYGDAQVYGNARVYGNACVYENARVSGDAQIYGNAWAGGDADISQPHQVVWFSNVGSENGTLTVYKTKDGVQVTRGCFTGTPKEFLKASQENHDVEIQEEYKGLLKIAVKRVNR